ncbi:MULTISPECIES: pirin family protein [Vibrio]|jgi:redox-sensitive bicupin YhaK (pirin superfamily)|uniref:pirin family protein n=1 Tax=Vibrio TaxID=662 RepID=UPI000BFFB90F|nr:MULTISPECIES: pirin family protein [unclassified Vibrio]PHJ42864.1 pirin [Vibrio sp. PID17_43]RIZ54179.1 pirin [Vibrio sp. PID23_8]
MITVRHADDRGRASYGWLNSKHTFSFGNYYDPQHMGFSALRVINDDIVQPNAGFDTHGHQDMEIISYVLEGEIAHKDSEGNVQTLSAGEFQLMSAGTGIYHSEYNASNTSTLRFLQIWIEPNTFGNRPSYQQKNFSRKSGLTSIVTPTGEGDSLRIKQDASLHQLILPPHSQLSVSIQSGRNLYVHQVEGELEIDNTSLSGGDGAKVEKQDMVTFRNDSAWPATALVFDLP